MDAVAHLSRWKGRIVAGIGTFCTAILFTILNNVL